MNRNDLPAPNKECEVCGRKYRRCKKCIELKNRGVEAWREHCDSIECYMTLVFSQTEDISNVSMEEYERIVALELPEGRKPIPEIQEKLDAIKAKLEGKTEAKAEIKVEAKEEVKAETEAKVEEKAEKIEPSEETVFVPSKTDKHDGWKKKNNYKTWEPKKNVK